MTAVLNDLVNVFIGALNAVLKFPIQLVNSLSSAVN